MSLQPQANDAPAFLSKLHTSAQPTVKTRLKAGDHAVEIEPCACAPDRLVTRRVPPVQLNRGGPRGRITGLSVASARRYSRAVERTLTGGWVWYGGSLTILPSFTGDFRRCLQRMLGWLQRQGYAGFWILGRHKSGLPHAHIHLLVPARGFDKKQVREQWAKTTGCRELAHVKYGVWLKKLRSPVAYARYSSRSALKDGSAIPGRQWGQFGKLAMIPDRVLVASGRDKAVAQLVRIVYRAEMAARRKRGQARVPRRAWGTFRSFLAAQGILDRLPDLLEVLHLSRDAEPSIASLQRLIQGREEEEAS